MENESSIQVIDRAFQIIEVLSVCREKISLAEISSRTGIAKSTAFRILKSLKNLGYVSQNSYGQYNLTFKICGVSRRVLETTSIISVALPHMKRLCASVKQSINLVVREGDETVYIDRQDDATAPFRMTSLIGMRRPLHVSAVGKSILAAMPDEEIVEYWARTEKSRLTPYTIIELDKLFSEIHQARECGYTIDNQENTLGVRCIAANILNYPGQPAFAISISCPAELLTEEKIQTFVPFLLSSRSSISKALGTM